MTRFALSAMAACVAAVSLYALLRGLQLILFTEPNPAMVIWSAHAGYFWRALIVSYAGGMAAILTWLAAGRAPDRVARFLAHAVVVAAVLICLQGLFLP
ncbi:MAG: hypothetical protein ACLQVI_01250 [Polyangiaceae bacterium]|jgi:hypothetical protein